jgi:LuxR family maltose regulon positive regulatory protein
VLRAAWVALDAGDNDSVVEPLSERELDVLRRWRPVISIKRSLKSWSAVSTIKKHIGNIYGKLEVGNRTQAVARARELGLL